MIQKSFLTLIFPTVRVIFFTYSARMITNLDKAQRSLVADLCCDLAKGLFLGLAFQQIVSLSKVEFILRICYAVGVTILSGELIKLAIQLKKGTL